MADAILKSNFLFLKIEKLFLVIIFYIFKFNIKIKNVFSKNKFIYLLEISIQIYKINKTNI